MTEGYRTDRLASLDDKGFRRAIIPAEVKGFFRRHRDWTQAVLILIFLILPWITVNGNQLLLLNLGERKFSIFGTIFYAHDTPKLFFIIFIFVLSLVWVTSIWGRIWCGWACPQTVFIDGVYRRIEQWIEGNYIQRRKLHDSNWTFEKIWKKTLKWFSFVAVSSFFAHSFAAYFVGSHEIIFMLQKSPLENASTFGVVVFLTAFMVFDLGWFKEQFCVIMCPYGRFQSALMDQNSLAIVYDVARGEPRKGVVQPGEKQGDCVSCNRCVQVCPTGIDIRRGVQMDCITCTACIDACDEIMEKVKKPKGLIRYDSVSGKKATMFNIRSMLYLLLIAIASVGLVVTLSNRADLEITVLRAKEEPYTVISNHGTEQEILNHFRLHIKNQSKQDEMFKVELADDSVSQAIQMTIAQNPLLVHSGDDITVHIFVRFKQSILNSGTTKAYITLNDGKKPNKKELPLVGPMN